MPAMQLDETALLFGAINILVSAITAGLVAWVLASGSRGSYRLIGTESRVSDTDGDAEAQKKQALLQSNSSAALDDQPPSVATFTRQMHRPRRLILIRHGESEANVDRNITSEVPDHALHITVRGRSQAIQAGKNLKAIVGDESMLFVISPYVRTRETFHGVAQAFGGPEGLACREDVHAREQDFGNFDKPEMEAFQKEKKIFGKFYYRFPDGESPSDVYNRATLFLDALYRRWEMNMKEQNLVIVAHNLFIIVFLMRLFRYSVEDFYNMESLENCEIVCLERPADSLSYNISYTWAPFGEKIPEGRNLWKKPRGTKKPMVDKDGNKLIWDGDPNDMEPFVRDKPS